MDCYPKFGECLDLLLSALDMKRSTLARGLNIDASLVSRWIHGKRVPSYRSHYVEDIAKFISKGILNSFHEKRLVETIKTIDKSITDNMNICEKIKKVLLEAQGHSIELGRARLSKDSKKSEKDKASISKLITSCSDDYKINIIQEDGAKIASNQLQGDLDMLNINTAESYVIELSHQDKIVIGCKNILDIGLKLLEAAAQKQCSKGETIIYITFNNDIDIFYRHNDLLLRWTDALYEALKKGWNIIILMRLSNDLNRVIRLIRFIQPLLGVGNFNPYYFKKYDTLSTGKEMLIVPEIGALSCYPTKKMSGIDCAFFFRNPIALKILSKHLSKEIILTSAQPLINDFSLEKIPEFKSELADFESCHGNRYLYMDGLGALTLPSELYLKYLKRGNILPEERAVKLNFHKKSLDSFYSSAIYYECKDIYTKESIEKLLNHGLYPLDSFYGDLKFRANPKDIVTHLSNIVNLLKKYDKYEIALISENQFKNHTQLYWMVKEKHSVKIETWNRGQYGFKKNLSIEEPTIVKAFEEYFMDIWEHISPISRDKREVISWFESKIKTLSQGL